MPAASGARDVGHGVVADVHAARGLDPEPLERDLERPRVGLGGADLGRRDDRLEAARRARARASTSGSETSQFATRRA